MLKIIAVIVGMSEDNVTNEFRKAYNPKDPASVIGFLESRDWHAYTEDDRCKTDVTIVWENGDEYKMTYVMGERTTITERLNAKKALAYTEKRLEGKTGFFADRLLAGAREAVAFMEGKATSV